MERHPELHTTAPHHPRTRTVLLAEDDDAVREFVRAVLEQSGFAVAAAPDGRAAGDLFAADPDRFDLVLTDVIMPHAIGPELAARVRAVRPNLPVLFMSAFPSGPGIAPDPLPADEALLEKPFSIAALQTAVAAALGDAALIRANYAAASAFCPLPLRCCRKLGFVGWDKALRRPTMPFDALSTVGRRKALSHPTKPQGERA